MRSLLLSIGAVALAGLLCGFENSNTGPAAVASGRFIVFAYWDPRGDRGDDIGLYDRESGVLGRPAGLNSAHDERRPSITRDGRYIAFDSDRPGGAGNSDVYLYDRNSSRLVDIPGLNSEDMDWHPAISPDGRYIAFSSYRTGATGGTGDADVYLYDRAAGMFVDLPGLNSAAWDANPSLSWEARYIAFESFESDRSGAAGDVDVFVYNRDAQGIVELPNLNSRAGEGDISVNADGRYIGFESKRDEGLYVCLFDRKSNSLVDLPGLDPAPFRREPSLSADGRYLVLVSEGRTNAARYRVCLYDRKCDRLLDLSKLNFLVSWPDIN